MMLTIGSDYTYFSESLRDDLNKALWVLVNEPARLTEVLTAIKNARSEWGIGSACLSSAGWSVVRECYLDFQTEQWGRKVHLFGQDWDTPVVFEKLHTEDEIAQGAAEMFNDGGLRLQGSDSWGELINMWLNIKAMAVNMLDGFEVYTADEVAKELDCFIDGLNVYYGFDEV